MGLTGATSFDLIFFFVIDLNIFVFDRRRRLLLAAYDFGLIPCEQFLAVGIDRFGMTHGLFLHGARLFGDDRFPGWMIGADQFPLAIIARAFFGAAIADASDHAGGGEQVDQVALGDQILDVADGDLARPFWEHRARTNIGCPTRSSQPDHIHIEKWLAIEMDGDIGDRNQSPNLGLGRAGNIECCLRDGFLEASIRQVNQRWRARVAAAIDRSPETQRQDHA